jgi:phage-related minor tail protein
VVALLVAPVVGACGSDSGGLSGAKAAYVAQVDPICAELQGDIGELGQEPAKQAEEIEKSVQRIRDVSKPRDDSILADRFIAAMQNLFLSLQDVDESRKVNDQPRAQKALDGVKANAEDAASAAKDYGMVVCARKL